MKRILSIQNRQLLLFAGLCLILASCATFSPQENSTDPHESPYLLIDVRTEEEFAAGHLKKSILIPYEEIGDNIGELTCCYDQHIVVYCKRGGRAAVARRTLLKMGYTNVTNAGSYKELIESGEYK